MNHRRWFQFFFLCPTNQIEKKGRERKKYPKIGRFLLLPSKLMSSSCFSRLCARSDTHLLKMMALSVCVLDQVHPPQYLPSPRTHTLSKEFLLCSVFQSARTHYLWHVILHTLIFDQRKFVFTSSRSRQGECTSRAGLLCSVELLSKPGWEMSFLCIRPFWPLAQCVPTRNNYTLICFQLKAVQSAFDAPWPLIIFLLSLPAFVQQRFLRNFVILVCMRHRTLCPNISVVFHHHCWTKTDPKLLSLFYSLALS